MIQINIGDHISPELGWVAVPTPHLETLKWARRRAIAVARDMPSADRYFMRLPRRRSLRALLADRSIWINYNPSLRDVYGQQSGEFPHEIALGQLAFAQGRWMVLATLPHELAHVNGAEGGTDRRAELTLIHCGLGRRSELTGGDDPRTPFMPDIEG